VRLFRHRHRVREWIEVRRDPAEGPPLSYGWVGRCRCGEIVERRPSPAAMKDLGAYQVVMGWTP